MYEHSEGSSGTVVCALWEVLSCSGYVAHLYYCTAVSNLLFLSLRPTAGARPDLGTHSIPKTTPQIHSFNKAPTVATNQKKITLT